MQDFPADDEFEAGANEMLGCFQEGKYDYAQNFECPYDWGTMRAGAWMAGYAKAMEKDNGKSKA